MKKNCKMHNWNIPPQNAIQLQLNLQKKIKIIKLKKTPKLIAGCDASFKNNKATGVVIVMDINSMKTIEIVKEEVPLTYPYIPGLLSFREAPVLLKCIRKLKNIPDIFIFDGQGIAHPRKMGIATHIGILIEKPTIGCAKSILTGKYSPPQKEKGSYSYIKNKNNEIIGAAVRTKENTKPVFVSIGNRITLEECINIILKTTTKYKLPEPTRLADKLSKKPNL